jgi:glycosidase
MTIKLKKSILLCVGALFAAQNISAQYSMPSPSWAKDLIIYELNPKGFTSPEGPETGTFNSVREKIPYLEELGVNGIWFTGHTWGDHRHFYNIWTQYACIRHDSIEPTLGTPEEFKAMVADFHSHGIKVFLDIITHGVINYSPLILQHPSWFKGGSWGMTDFDWYGGHADLDEWWVKTHTDYVTQYGVDGYRLDVDMYRPDLWNKIKENAVQAGHPIVVFDEPFQYCEGVSDFYQAGIRLSVQTKGIDRNCRLVDNPAAFYSRFISAAKDFSVRSVLVTYSDDTQVNDLPFTLIADVPDAKIKISGLDPAKTIKGISASIAGNGGRSYYRIAGAKSDIRSFPLFISGLSEITVSFTPHLPDNYLQTVQLSCHDDGWDTFPLSDNPYVAEGSRCLFGYSCLFQPAIPVFMSGEEFDAGYVPFPSHSPFLFKKEKVGQGKWLYATWMQWDQLKEKKHADMLADVKKMIAIRKQESNLIHALQNNVLPNLDSLAFSCSAKVPVPFIIRNDETALIVAGNPTDKDVKITIDIPLDKIRQGAKKITVTDLWNGGEKEYTPDGLKKFSFTVKKDHTAGGGISVFKIEWE